MSPDEIKDWLPPAGMPCHVIITTVVDRWPSGMPMVLVEPLPDEKTLDLVRAIGGDAIVEKYGESVVKVSGGLPIQICPLAETLTREHKRGLDKHVEFARSDDANKSFERVYKALSPDQQLLVHTAARLNPQRILRDHLFRHLQEPEVMNETEVVRALDACMDLTLLQGSDQLRMHQLMADFVANIPLQEDLKDKFKKVRQTQAKHLVELARKFGNAPADSNLAAELTAFPLSVGAWGNTEGSFSGAQEHVIGYALHEMGRWADALPWFERAIKAAEKGDMRGKVDHESLGKSLDGVGVCYLQLGKFEASISWYEQAVQAKERGDIHGRVDHSSLGRSLHQVGFCYSQVGKFEEALPWFERAVKAAERGDAYGRVDSDSLGASFNLAGMCYWDLGRFEDALPLYERAVQAKQQGDIHGRVDHESLGKSLLCVGGCYSKLGRFEEALPWYERAARAAEKGDIHGRVNNESLGKNLHEVGWCYANLGRIEEALPWFERAVEEAERGDIHGRVDEESLQISRNTVRNCLKQLGRL